MEPVGPVPGSIGSAVSGPEAVEPTPMDGSAFTTPAGSPQSVSFTDPATQPEMGQTAAPAKPAKKKTSKNTLIALVIVAVMVVIALAVVLMIQLGVIQI